MNASLWTCQVVLAAVFLYSGLAKSTQPVPALVARGQTGVADTPAPIVRFAGISELLGVVALVAGVHLQRREYRTTLGDAALFALCATVAIGRFRDHV